MKVCGIELKASEARLFVLEGTYENYEIVHLEQSRFKLKDSKSQEVVKQFRDDLLGTIDWLDAEHIGIRERMSKGRFAGGALSFKIEGLIQTSDYAVELVHSASIKSKLKDMVLEIDGLPKYSQEAFRVALYLLIKHG